MGNVRLSYTKNGSGTEIIEENNFYPFGLKHEGYNAVVGNPSYNYQYNGKELQKETGWSDYGARMYMADIGRWGVIDPLAETSRRFTSYNYAYNNPISFIDPDGRKAESSDQAESNIFNLNAPEDSFWWAYAKGSPVVAGSGDSIGAFFTQMKKALGISGGGSITVGETQWFKDVMAELNGSPSFQFPKGQEEYYKKNYPAFYDLVKNILPNILKDSNYLKALMDVTGMSKEALEKTFTYGEEPILQAREIWSDAIYDYSASLAKEDLNSISIDIVKVLNWYEKANKDPNTITGVANIFYMTALVGHEAAHWGNQMKGPVGENLIFLNKFNNAAGGPEHGKAFEFKLFNGLYPKAVVAPGILDMGHANDLSKYLNNYVSKNFNNLSNIFKNH